MEKALSFNEHINVAETAVGVAEYLGGPMVIAGDDSAPEWLCKLIQSEGSAGYREFLIIELAPFINDAYAFAELVNGSDIFCFYAEFIPAFFEHTRTWSHFRASSARAVGVAIGQQSALNAPIPFNS